MTTLTTCRFLSILIDMKKRLPPVIDIRTLRKSLGLSSTQLAERIAAEGVEVHPDSLLNIELGHKPASKGLMRAYAQALRVNPLDIYQHEDLEEIFDPKPRKTNSQGARLNGVAQ